MKVNILWHMSYTISLFRFIKITVICATVHLHLTNLMNLYAAYAKLCHVIDLMVLQNLASYANFCYVSSAT